MAQDIQTLVVLMLENRAFDHMLGFLKRTNPAVDGLTGTEWNPSNPLAPADHVAVSPTAQRVLDPDPGHTVEDTNVQLFSRQGGPPAAGPSNAGFIWSYSQQKPAPSDPTSIMRCFDPGTLPVLTTLATQFAICDAWFSSVPGPTWPNRFFAHAATSKGYITNSLFNNYDMATVFERLAAHGRTWRIYYHDFAQSWALHGLQTPANRTRFSTFGRFKTDARDGALPNYAFIEPKYFSFFGEANDQHPPHDMQAGERLIAEVYEALRTSPQWRTSMLVILYDEHGGTYDHVLPPAAVPPDDHTSQFGFDRYGVRVPAVIVSPFVPAGPVHTTFDHTSIPATISAIFGLPGFLTARDAAANRFDVLATLTSPRTDVPDLSAPASGRSAATRPKRKAALGATVTSSTTTRGLSDFQQDLVELARSLERRHGFVSARALTDATRPRTERTAALYVRRVAAQMTRPTTTPRARRRRK